MKYYIVMNEWNYPTETGREFIGDYDTEGEAILAAGAEYNKEMDNFQAVTHDLSREASGVFHNDDGSVAGFALHASQFEDADHFFRSIIIPREVI